MAEVFELSEKFLKVQVAVKWYHVSVGVAVVIVDMQAGKLAIRTSSGNRYSLRSNSHDLCHSKISRYHGFRTGQTARQETAGAGYSQRRYRHRFLLRTVLSWRNSLYRNEILRAEQAVSGVAYHGFYAVFTAHSYTLKCSLEDIFALWAYCPKGVHAVKL